MILTLGLLPIIIFVISLLAKSVNYALTKKVILKAKYITLWKVICFLESTLIWAAVWILFDVAVFGIWYYETFDEKYYGKLWSTFIVAPFVSFIVLKAKSLKLDYWKIIKKRLKNHSDLSKKQSNNYRYEKDELINESAQRRNNALTKILKPESVPVIYIKKNKKNRKLIV